MDKNKYVYLSELAFTQSENKINTYKHLKDGSIMDIFTDEIHPVVKPDCTTFQNKYDLGDVETMSGSFFVWRLAHHPSLRFGLYRKLLASAIMDHESPENMGYCKWFAANRPVPVKDIKQACKKLENVQEKYTKRDERAMKRYAKYRKLVETQTKNENVNDNSMGL